MVRFVGGGELEGAGEEVPLPGPSMGEAEERGAGEDDAAGGSAMEGLRGAEGESEAAPPEPEADGEDDMEMVA